MDQSTKNILFIGAASVGIYLLWKNYNKKKAVVDTKIITRDNFQNIRQNTSTTLVKSDIDAFFQPVDIPLKEDQAATLVATKETLGEPVLITKTR